MEIPKKPIKQLSKQGKELYNNITEYLKKINKYDEIDHSLIILMADTYDLYLKNKAVVDVEGAFLERQNGNKYLHPAYTVMQQAIKSIKSLAGALGIGAEARNKMGVEPRQEEDEFLKFLKETSYDDEE